jgi:hypothetical protein
MSREGEWQSGKRIRWITAAPQAGKDMANPRAKDSTRVPPNSIENAAGHDAAYMPSETASTKDSARVSPNSTPER